MADIPINTLSRRPKRKREPLAAAPEPEAIPATRNIALRTAGDAGTGGGGLAWPLTELQYTGTEFLSLTSSDGLFVFEYPATTDYLDDDGNVGTVVHL